MSDQPYRIKFRRNLDALTGSPEATDALLAHANAAASERIERVVIDEHQQGVVMAGWLLTFPEVLAAVLPDLLAAAWDEGYLEAVRAAHRVAEGYACTHHWQDTGNPGTRYCAQCGTEWTEAIL